MTMSNERTRALVWAGGLLIELARDKSLPLIVRQQAVQIARHFPTVEQVSSMANPGPLSDFGMGLEDPGAHPEWAEQCRFSPLSYSTRLSWPEE